MVTLMSQQSWREGDGDGTSAATRRWFSAGVALGVAGLATASTAITCTVVLQHGNDDDDSNPFINLLALSSGLFYTGIAEVCAAVWVMAEPRGRVAAGRRLLYASLVPLTAAVGMLAAATLFWW